MGIEPTPSYNGYWIVDDAGRVFHYGDAGFYGDQPALGKGERVSTMSGSKSGHRYWLSPTRAGRSAMATLASSRT